MKRDWYAPIVADAEAGFGGVLNAYELMKACALRPVSPRVGSGRNALMSRIWKYAADRHAPRICHWDGTQCVLVEFRCSSLRPPSLHDRL